MRYLISAFCLLLSQVCLGQRIINVTDGNGGVDTKDFYMVGGTPFVNAKFVKLVDGTPYFSENWMEGVVVANNGTIYKGLTLRLDLFDNNVHYKDEKNNEMIATTQIKEVVLSDSFLNNYRFVHSESLPQVSPGRNSWYLWLASGPASLYKFFDKKLSEQTPYGAATVEQRIRTYERYLIHYNNSLLEIKKLKDAPAVLANRKTELEDFLKTRDDKNKSLDDRFVALMDYYNSLVKEKEQK